MEAAPRRGRLLTPNLPYRPRLIVSYGIDLRDKEAPGVLLLGLVSTARPHWSRVTQSSDTAPENGGEDRQKEAKHGNAMKAANFLLLRHLATKSRPLKNFRPVALPSPCLPANSISPPRQRPFSLARHQPRRRGLAFPSPRRHVEVAAAFSTAECGIGPPRGR